MEATDGAGPAGPPAPASSSAAVQPLMLRPAASGSDALATTVLLRSDHFAGRCCREHVAVTAHGRTAVVVAAPSPDIPADAVAIGSALLELLGCPPYPPPTTTLPASPGSPGLVAVAFIPRGAIATVTDPAGFEVRVLPDGRGGPEILDLLVGPSNSAARPAALGSLRRALHGMAWTDGGYGVLQVLRHPIAVTLHRLPSSVFMPPPPMAGVLPAVECPRLAVYRVGVSGGVDTSDAPLVVSVARSTGGARGNLVQLLQSGPSANRPPHPLYQEYHDQLRVHLVHLVRRAYASASANAPAGGRGHSFVSVAGPVGQSSGQCAVSFADQFQLPRATIALDDLLHEPQAPGTCQRLDTALASITAGPDVPAAVLIVDAMGYVPAEAGDESAGPVPATPKWLRGYISAAVTRTQLLVVLLTCADGPAAPQKAIAAICSHRIEMSPPAAADRGAMVRQLLGGSAVGLAIATPAGIERMAQATSGCDLHGLHRLCRAVWSRSVLDQLGPPTPTSAVGIGTGTGASSGNGASYGGTGPVLSSPVTMTWPAHAAKVRELAGPSSSSFGTHRHHHQSKMLAWDRIGGYGKLKERIRGVFDAAVAGSQPGGDGGFGGCNSPAASGMLLHGPTGCGKTLLAQTALANCKLNVIAVDAADILSKYVGETEATIRKLFDSARRSRPSAIFIDEIDSLARKRGSSGSSTGVEERALSQLLNEMDGIQNTAGVFLVGCTNRPLDELDSAILRPGRLEVHLFVGPPEPKDCRQIAAVFAQGYRLADTEAVVQRVVELGAGKTAAGIAGLFAQAAMAAIERCDDADEDLVLTVADLPCSR